MHKDKRKYLKYKRKYNKAYRTACRKRMFNYLQNNPCVDCGESNPVVLQFDHVRGKKSLAVSTMVSRTYSWSKTLKEIKKCEVVCSNCHSIRTSKQQKWYDW